MLLLRTRFSRAFAAFMSNEADETVSSATSRMQPKASCFILEICKAPSKLVNEPVQPEGLVKQYIGLDRDTQSVFQASSDIEEVEALAALLACRDNAGGPDPRYGIRFLESDLVGLPVTAIPTPGDTGVQKVDRRHFDLQSDTEGFTRLMRRLIERIHAGEHRVRTAGTHQIALMLRAFSGLDDSEIDKGRKDRCKKILKTYNKF